MYRLVLARSKPMDDLLKVEKDFGSSRGEFADDNHT